MHQTRQGGEGLDFLPCQDRWQANLGDVSKEAWPPAEHQTMLVNENRLNLADTRARKVLLTQMEQYFFGEGVDQPVGTCHEDLSRKRRALRTWRCGGRTSRR